MFVSISQPSSSIKYYENENVFDIINEINMNSTMYERMNEGCEMFSILYPLENEEDSTLAKLHV
jgi:glucan phosphoethanolaminetransferase (alkaline phosphatase superfamily)